MRTAFSNSNKEVYSLLHDVKFRYNYNNYSIINFSGSTCVSLMTYGKKLFIANVGDSRAVIMRV